MSSGKWIKLVLASVALILLLMATTIYVIDPCGIYGERAYYYNELRGSTLGIMRHAQYEDVIIGSSMAQNFDLDQVNSVLNWRAVKLTLNGLGLEDISFLLHQLKNRKINNVMIVLDLHIFNEDKDLKFWDYLVDDGIVNDVSYWLSYELWVRAMPKSLLRHVYSSFVMPVHGTDFAEMARLGEWGADFVFGKEVVVDNYLNNRYSVSQMNKQNMLPRMQNRLASFVADIAQNLGNTRVYFVLPPYSALYWHLRAEEGCLSDLLKFKKCFLETVTQHANLCCFDFQAWPLITDLGYYKDPTHFHPSVNRRIVECLKTGENQVENTSSLSNALLESMLDDFAAQNSDWLKTTDQLK